jgi:hypothetical protein
MSKNSEARPRLGAQAGSIEFTLTMPLAAFQDIRAILLGCVRGLERDFSSGEEAR